jgi:hypothetical protein
MLSFGLLSRHVADLQLAFPLIAGPDGEDCEVPPVPTSRASMPPINRPLRIAWWDDFAGSGKRRGFAGWLTSHRPALGGGAFTATLRGNGGVPWWFPSATPERLR